MFLNSDMLAINYSIRLQVTEHYEPSEMDRLSSRDDNDSDAKSSAADDYRETEEGSMVNPNLLSQLIRIYKDLVSLG